MTISNFKYFEYCHPVNITDPYYGLYEPVTECFLAVTDSLDVITQLRYMVSSRYHTYICQLNHASNYTMEIIDNEVCTNWSLTNKPDIPLSAAFQNNKIVIVNELCPTSRTDNTGLLDEQQWNLYCIHWIKGFIQQELRNSTLPGYSYSDSDNFINDFLQIENIGPDIKNDIQLESKRHILKLLYLGQDITVTEEAINQVIFAQHE